MSRIRRIAGLGLAIALACATPGQPAAQRPQDEGTRQLLVDAVEAAADLDLYSARCRSDGSGRRTDNLNKALVGKFRMTVIQVQDDFFPERSYRRVQDRLQGDFLERLRAAGGCKEAKQAGMPDQLRERYDGLVRQIDALP
jgi:hypothetical protein